MTKQEFDQTAFSAGVQFKYRGFVYGLVSVNFQEKLIGLYDGLDAKDCEEQDVMWVRCENAELLP